MMVEAATWDDWSTSETRVIGGEDKWHVALAPGEVKVLSLEQLDDLFRLSIVDAETKVWQNGMSEWQPLGVIAGIEQSAPVPRSEPPRPPKRAPAPPSAPPRPLSRAPNVVNAYARPLVPTAFYEPPASAAPRTSMAPTASVRPMTITEPALTAGGGGGLGRLLFGITLLAGVSVTSYRNGLVREAAHAAHRDAQYAWLEAKLGGPPFGTLRGVEKSTAAQRELLVKLTPHPVNALTAAAIPAVASSDGVTATLSTRVAIPPSTSAQTAAKNTPVTPVVSLESLTHEAKGTSAAKALAAPARAGSVVQSTRQSKPRPVEKAPPVSQKPDSQMSDRERLNVAIGQSVDRAAKPSNKSSAKSKSNEYDPLNPSL